MQIINQENILKNFIKQASAKSIRTEEDLHKMKKTFSKSFNLNLPTNFSLQNVYEKLIKEGWAGDKIIQRLIRKRKIRTMSGVSVITVLTKAYSCPGKCVFCPTEPGMPKSYLSNEPGAMRAVLDDFHPREQVKTRLESLRLQGHETDKIEMIILGGTFSAYKRRYQNDYIRAIFNACNDKSAKSLEQAQKINENSRHRIIGLSLETRPDHITKEEIKRMRGLGCTKVQIGIQHTNNEVLDLCKRGEHIEDSMRALKLMKDAGLKIAAHLMPNLPGSNPETDVAMLKEIFDNPNLRPDQIKIYPCVVTPYSELEVWHREGRYKNYDDKTLVRILMEMKKNIPEYVRIERIFRDIPGESIISGSQKTNMRQLLEKIMKNEGVRCRCIRCREIKGESYNPDSMKLKIDEFEASGGKEFFLTYNDTLKDKLCSLLRLRFHSYSIEGKKHFIKELEGASVVRELHTYGYQVKIGKNTDNASQHAGLGRKLLNEAEQLTKKAGLKKVAVIAGVGTRNYYRKWGYELDGTYMIKQV